MVVGDSAGQLPSLGISLGDPVRVQEVPVGQRGDRRSWSLYDSTYRRIAPVEKYLRYLDSVGRSPNTVRTYCSGLKAYWTFLIETGIDWQDADASVLAEFAAHLHRPARQENVVVLNPAVARSARTVDTYLAAVYGLYEYWAVHHEVFPRFPIVLTDKGRRNPYKQQIRVDSAQPHRSSRPVRMPTTKRLPRALTIEQVRAVIGAQTRLRDRLLFSLLVTTGMRIGMALALRHEDIEGWDGVVRPKVRDESDRRRRLKRRSDADAPAPNPKFLVEGVVRLYNDYLFEEFRDCESDYVFVNLWGGDHGRPLQYASVVDAVATTRRKVGFHFTLHWLRHTFATMCLESGMPLHVLSDLMDHASVATTKDIYGHLTPEHLREQLEAAGLLQRAFAEAIV